MDYYVQAFINILWIGVIPVVLTVGEPLRLLNKTTEIWCSRYKKKNTTIHKLDRLVSPSAASVHLFICVFLIYFHHHFGGPKCSSPLLQVPSSRHASPYHATVSPHVHPSIPLLQCAMCNLL